jgi:hypothetical protein
LADHKLAVLCHNEALCLLIEGECGVTDAAADIGSWGMDPLTTTAAAGAASGCILRLVHRWISLRAQTRRAELHQQGLSERTRLLPPGSRLVEKTAHHDADILIGGTATARPTR